MKTSQYLKEIQKNFMGKSTNGDYGQYFLCLVAEHICFPRLDKSILHEILEKHDLSTRGEWTNELEYLKEQMPRADFNNLKIFVRGLFLHLAIKHYESKGD